MEIRVSSKRDRPYRTARRSRHGHDSRPKTSVRRPARSRTSRAHARIPSNTSRRVASFKRVTTSCLLSAQPGLVRRVTVGEQDLEAPRPGRAWCLGLDTPSMRRAVVKPLSSFRYTFLRKDTSRPPQARHPMSWRLRSSQEPCRLSRTFYPCRCHDAPNTQNCIRRSLVARPPSPPRFMVVNPVYAPGTHTSSGARAARRRNLLNGPRPSPPPPPGRRHPPPTARARSRASAPAPQSRSDASGAPHRQSGVATIASRHSQADTAASSTPAAPSPAARACCPRG